MAKTISIEFNKISIKLLLNILDKHLEKHSFGSPVEQSAFNETYTKLKVALFELAFVDY